MLRRLMGAGAALPLAFLLLCGAGAPAPVEAQCPPPPPKALWVAESGGALKIGADDGTLLLEITDVGDMRAVALDPAAQRVWVYSPPFARSYDLDGQLQLAVDLSLSEPSHVEMAVNSADGSVWVGGNTELFGLDQYGQVLHSLVLSAGVQELELDSQRGLLWVATADGVDAYDAASAAPVVSLDLGRRVTVKDLGIDLPSGEVWVATKNDVRRFSTAGALLATSPIRSVVQVSGDGFGGAWAATSKVVHKLDPSGQTLSTGKPFGKKSSIEDMVADTVDLYAWLSDGHSLAKLDASGQLVDYLEFASPIRIWDLALFHPEPDLTPPSIQILSPTQGQHLATLSPSVELAWSDDSSGIDESSLAFLVDGQPTAFDCSTNQAGATCTPAAAFAEGTLQLSATVVDCAANASLPAEVQFTVDVTAPAPVAPEDLVVTPAIDGQTTASTQPGGAEAGTTAQVTNTATGGSTQTGVAADGSFWASLEGSTGDLIEVVLADAAGNQSPATAAAVPDLAPPPDPSAVAPPNDPTVPTDFFTTTSFLWAGAPPIQLGVAPGTIDPERVAVLRGRVTDRAGTPVEGVVVTIHGGPQYGTTLTRADGRFDMGVNGGGYLSVDFRVDGYLPVRRKVNTPWRDYVHMDDIVVVALDSAVTTVVAGSSEVQVAQATTTSDADGPRTPTLLVPAGTQAEMVLGDGSRQPLSSLAVRATEYTVGPDGPRAMPAALPRTSAYTHAFELSADEAIAASATSVEFSQTLYYYLENYLGFPAGEIVPVGYYDRTKDNWIGSENGLVIAIHSIAGGLAEIDVDGSGQPADAATLAALGFDDAERQRLAELYTAGQTLWRVPITHFTPYDCNWPYGPPDDATNPPQSAPTGNGAPPADRPDCRGGSVIDCQNQILHEDVELVGTPFTLHYDSSRTRFDPGVNVTLSEASIPASLQSIVLEIAVGGRLIRQVYPPAPNLSHTFVWDGLDVYGRPMFGTTKATFSIKYVYPLRYFESSSSFSRAWGRVSESRVEVASRTSAEFAAVTVFELDVKARDPVTESLGGWSLSPLHYYEAVSKELFLGDGGRISAEALGSVVTPYAGDGSLWVNDPPGDGGPAIEGLILRPGDLAMGPDGSVYVSDIATCRVRRIDPEGIIWTAAGTGVCGFSGDGGPATQAQLNQPVGLAVDSRGNVFINDTDNWRIRRIGPDGIIETIAGDGTIGSGLEGEDGPAIDAKLDDPWDLEVDSTGQLYFTDGLAGVGTSIFKIDPEGIIRRVRGGIWAIYPGLGIDSADNIYVAEDDVGEWVKRSGTDGTWTTVAGWTDGNTYGCDPDVVAEDGVPATQTFACPTDVAVDKLGNILFADRRVYRIRLITPDGIIHTATGCQQEGCTSVGSLEGSPAAAFAVSAPRSLLPLPDGDVLVALTYPSTYGWAVYRLEGSLPGFRHGEFTVPSRYGDLLYLFDNQGRHLKTLDAITAHTVHEMQYDASGQVTGIIDREGDLTLIERDASGKLSAIVSPTGQRTEIELDLEGFIKTVIDPAGQRHEFTYFADGLMETMKTPRSHTYSFSFDSSGLLESDSDPAGGSQTLARTETANGRLVQVSTAMGRTTSYDLARPAPGTEQYTTTDPAGLVEQTTYGANASTVALRADGTTITTTWDADPRFGMESPLPTTKVTTPAGLEQVISLDRQATLNDPADLLSLNTLTETLTVNGRSYTSTYDAALRQLSFSTPRGRQSSMKLDTQGRTTEVGFATLQPLRLTYDSEGRLSEIRQGTGSAERLTVLGYDAHGRLDTVTDPLSRTTSLGYDLADRLTSQVFPDSRVIGLGYDANGNPSSVTPPGRPAHAFDHTAIDLVREYDPPDIGLLEDRTLLDYNVDRQLELVTLPDGQTIDLAYGATSGRLDSYLTPRGTYTFGYDPVTGVLLTQSDPEGGSLTYTSDGVLLTGVTWAGEVAGSVAFSYLDDFTLDFVTVNGIHQIDLAYDSDRVLIQAGAETLVRDFPTGFLSETTLGAVSDSYSYDPDFGELSGYTADYGATTLYSFSITQRDALGRIKQRSETIGGVTSDYVYTYDDTGRLTDVTKDGSDFAHYAYDANSNRESWSDALGSGIAAYDDQDRLLTYGAASYVHTPSGTLISKTVGGSSVTYDYDITGGLRQVVLPSGITVDYLIDATGRRIGRKVNGVLTHGWLYRDDLAPVAELDGQGNLKYLFVYGSKAHVPDYIEEVSTGNRFRVISDHLGSVRLVVDISDGSILQRLDYDPFGRVLLDSNPGFQPFGFAGGLYDHQTGLVRFGARDYDSETGRWTSKDPILFGGRDVNLYRYVLDDPVNLIDPEGKLFNVAAGALGGIAGGLINGVYAVSQGKSFWKGAAVGAAAGLLGGLTLNPFVAGAMIGAATSAGNIYTGIDCPDSVGKGIAVGAGLGLLGGGVGGYLGHAGGYIGNAGRSLSAAQQLGQGVGSATGGVLASGLGPGAVQAFNSWQTGAQR